MCVSDTTTELKATFRQLCSSEITTVRLVQLGIRTVRANVCNKDLVLWGENVLQEAI